MLSKATKVVACIGSATVIISSQKLQAKELIACHECHTKRLPKARDLPIYEKKDDYVCEYDEKSTLPLISEISVIRKKLFHYASYVTVVQEKAVSFYETGVAHSKNKAALDDEIENRYVRENMHSKKQGTFDYLKSDENKIQRILVIASGGLVGLLFARRGGIFKKTLYTSLGTGAIFYVFYPSISKEYALIGWNFSKDNINNLLTKYGGYDTDKIAAETNAKIEYLKSAMKFESLMNTLNEKFYKKDAASNEDGKNKEITNNKDMYTTRTA